MVSKALRFIWEHLDQDLSIQDVVDFVEVPSRSLHRKFKHVIGRGIGAELTRKRLEYVCDRLVNSDMTVTEIAKVTGYKTRNYLHRVFHSEFGMTPTQYRKSHCAD